mgnify:CR=1 FL=1
MARGVAAGADRAAHALHAVDQVAVEIAQVMAGYSLGGADLLRDLELPLTRVLADMERTGKSEAEVRDGVPAHLRRGGCIVMEIDDEDPAFDVLDTYREDLDTDPGHHDQRRRHREPLRRAVG